MQILKYFFFALIILQSCSKDPVVENQPKPEVPLPDTLSASWVKINGFGQGFYDINFLDNNTGFVVGDSGLYKSIDGGYSWKLVSTVVAGDQFFSAASASSIFTVKADTLFKSFDGGASFEAQAFGLPFLSKPVFVNSTIGYLAGGGMNKLFKTTDGGHTWLPATNTTNLRLSGSHTLIFFLNENTGWISDGVSVNRTSGSVGDWSPVYPKSNAITEIYLPFAVSDQTVFISSPSRDFQGTEIFKSIDGGQHYTSIAQLINYKGGGWPDIYFTDENNGYAAVGSRIYMTSDGGANWSNVVSLGKNAIIELHFTDSSHGWACGANGTILVFKK